MPVFHLPVFVLHALLATGAVLLLLAAIVLAGALIRSPAAADGAPSAVFLDASGRRRRVAGVAGCLAGLFCAAYAAVVVVTMVGGQVEPARHGLPDQVTPAAGEAGR